jgi:hypothetical protein
MSLLVGRLILIGVITSLAACASIKSFEDNPESQLTYRHSSFDLKFAWNTLQTGNDTVIEGLIINVRNIQVRDIDLNVTVLDTNGRVLSEGAVPPSQVNLRMNMNDSVPFSVKLKDAIIAKGNVLKFIIIYHTNDGSWYGHEWQSSFKVDAATGGAVEEQREKQK